MSEAKKITAPDMKTDRDYNFSRNIELIASDILPIYFLIIGL